MTASKLSEFKVLGFCFFWEGVGAEWVKSSWTPHHDILIRAEDGGGDDAQEQADHVEHHRGPHQAVQLDHIPAAADPGELVVVWGVQAGRYGQVVTWQENRRCNLFKFCFMALIVVSISHPRLFYPKPSRMARKQRVSYTIHHFFLLYYFQTAFYRLMTEW